MSLLSCSSGNNDIVGLFGIVDIHKCLTKQFVNDSVDLSYIGQNTQNIHAALKYLKCVGYTSSHKKTLEYYDEVVKV